MIRVISTKEGKRMGMAACMFLTLNSSNTVLALQAALEKSLPNLTKNATADFAQSVHLNAI
jgi:hypothetical protein